MISRKTQINVSTCRFHNKSPYQRRFRAKVRLKTELNPRFVFQPFAFLKFYEIKNFKWHRYFKIPVVHPIQQLYFSTKHSKLIKQRIYSHLESYSKICLSGHFSVGTTLTGIKAVSHLFTGSLKENRRSLGSEIDVTFVSKLLFYVSNVTNLSE